MSFMLASAFCKNTGHQPFMSERLMSGVLEQTDAKMKDFVENPFNIPLCRHPCFKNCGIYSYQHTNICSQMRCNMWSQRSPQEYATESSSRERERSRWTQNPGIELVQAQVLQISAVRTSKQTNQRDENHTGPG
jgi:hypothetical protein